MATYFISDLHLGAHYLEDSRRRERMVTAFLDSVKDDADAIYLLGDILDYWYEYKYVVPRGYVRFFGKLAELSDKGVKIVWIKGNHDIWIFDYLPAELGIEVVDGDMIETIEGHKCFLSHGDGVGRMTPSFRFIRGLFRNRLSQWLFSGIHPRWTVPFAYAWSRHSREAGQERGIPDDRLLENIRTFTTEYHTLHPDIEYFIFGHVHVLSMEDMGRGCMMVVLGEWISTFSYAVMTNDGLQLKKYGGEVDIKQLG